MKINQAGIDLIKKFEGCRLKAYPDPATGAEPITIGYGHTAGVKLGDVITQAQAEEFLLEDLANYESKVSHMVKNTISENQFSALVSFAYNAGIGNFMTSTLLKLVRLGDMKAAALEFPKWDKAAGKVMPGLLKRRLAEQALFSS